MYQLKPVKGSSKGLNFNTCLRYYIMLNTYLMYHKFRMTFQLLTLKK